MTPKPNLNRPGLPNYVGPKTGIFHALHHEVLVEYSHDVMERVDYVRKNQPKSELAVRLNNMLYLPPDRFPEVYKAYAEWDKADAEWDKADAERDKAYAEWDKADAELDKAYAEATLRVLAYVREMIPDSAWDEAAGKLRGT